MRRKSYITKALRAQPQKRKTISPKEFLAMQNLLSTLQVLSQKLVSELKVEDILHEIMKTLGEALEAVWVNIWELTPDGKATYIRQGYGKVGTESYIEHSRKHPLKLGIAFIGRAIKTKKTWSSSDMWVDPHLPRIWVERVKEQNFRAIVCAPQIVESAKAIGGMCVYFDHPRVLSDFEMRLITVAANQAAVAIVNANIYAELLAERDKTLAIIHSLSEGVILYDNEGRILLINPKAQELILVNAKEVVGKRITRAFAQTNVFVHNLYRINQLALAEYEPHEYTIEGPMKLTLEVMKIPVYDAERRKIGVMQILRDITREKQVDLLKSQFVSTASHQMRTPLSKIRWALDLLKKGERGALLPPQQELITGVLHAADSMVELLATFLDVSKIEEGKTVYSFKKQAFLPLVEKILEKASLSLKERNLRVTLLKPAYALPLVSFDEKVLAMAIQNIADNAVRYSHEGQKIEIKLETAVYHQILSIKDTGIGIPKDEQGFIFVKFFRAHNARLFQPNGSGLGLYLAKKIVESHNGRITFESEENKGSTFMIYLPLDPQKMPH